MLSPDRKAVIARLACEVEDPAAVARGVRELRSAAELQHFAATYNWDDGFDVPAVISEHPACDLGVALTLFWLADGMSLYCGQVKATEHNADWVAFSNALTSRILNGHYVKGEASFTFPQDNVALYKYRKRGVPDVLLTSVDGLLSPSSIRPME